MNDMAAVELKKMKGSGAWELGGKKSLFMMHSGNQSLKTREAETGQEQGGFGWLLYLTIR